MVDHEICGLGVDCGWYRNRGFLNSAQQVGNPVTVPIRENVSIKIARIPFGEYSSHCKASKALCGTKKEFVTTVSQA